MRLRHPSILLALTLAACGGGGGAASTEEDEVALDTSGDETSGDAADDGIEDSSAGGDDEVAAPASGPGQLHVVNRVNGQDAGGNVRVLDASGEEVAHGASGATFDVDSGQYRVVGEITDDDVLIDTPTHELDGMATVAAGQTADAFIDFPVSRIQVRVTRGGRPIAQWRLVVTREGDEDAEPITLRPSEGHVPITPGRYSGQLTAGANRIEVNGLIFQGGATMTVPVNIN
ncbi:MAG: hypothetical protein AB7S26_11320 [Sandaracinaceae bacterium]